MAGIYFSQSRDIELSTLEYITTQVNASWTGVTIVKTFKNAYDNAVEVPIICVRLASTNNARLELGATTLENRYMLMFDIFSKSDAQRVDLSDYIVEKLKDGWAYKAYSHVSGDKSQIVGVADGRIFVTDWLTNMKVDYGENVDPKDRYRHTISVLVKKSS
jgi:hypothetical protein